MCRVRHESSLHGIRNSPVYIDKSCRTRGRVGTTRYCLVSDTQSCRHAANMLPSAGGSVYTRQIFLPCPAPGATHFERGCSALQYLNTQQSNDPVLVVLSTASDHVVPSTLHAALRTEYAVLSSEPAVRTTEPAAIRTKCAPSLHYRSDSAVLGSEPALLSCTLQRGYYSAIVSS
jgi:hypothetical protein